MNKIVILDDNDGRAKMRANELDALPSLSGKVTTVPLEGKAATDAIRQLVGRQLALRGSPPSDFVWGRSPFDDADVALLDYDLATFSGAGCATGEDLSYLIRLGSTCGAIVLMNRVDSNYFDLSMTSDFHLVADFEIGSQNVTTPSFWPGGPSPFRPWFLRNPFKHAERLESLASTISEGGVEMSLVDLLGTSESRFLALPLSELVASDPERKSKNTPDLRLNPSVAQVLFHHVVLRPQEREVFRDWWANREGVSLGKGAPGFLSLWSRVAAARILAWLGRRVVRPQHLTLELPYLLSVYPSLSDNRLRERVGEFDDSTDPPLMLGGDGLKDCLAVEISKLWGRAVWWKADLRRTEQIAENGEEWEETLTLDTVFCEDTATFRRRELADVFRSYLEGSYSVRFCSEPQDGEDELDIRRLPLDAFDV